MRGIECDFLRSRYRLFAKKRALELYNNSGPSLKKIREDMRNKKKLGNGKPIGSIAHVFVSR